MSFLEDALQRSWLSLNTFPTLYGWLQVVLITLASTSLAGLVAVKSSFVHHIRDYDPPWRGAYRLRVLHWSAKPLLAFAVPSLAEEVLWRGALIAPHPSASSDAPRLVSRAALVLAIHVASHPVAAATFWPRGKGVFCDWRFLVPASIVLAGATGSYLVTNGSAWAAAVTHWVPVALWRDCFGGEAVLQRVLVNAAAENNDGGMNHPRQQQWSKQLGTNLVPIV